ncbi:hypothetical protein [Leptospira vanthielii]|uniref:hypothetical protein n=1 Tax=Leptospira vanthielii TaxID=293085 RepID=UPI0012F93991|nr:hypothetical protein [Leptospira vanthielii]
MELAEWIAGRISKGKVLSIGSGLSFMEKVMHENYKSLEVHVQDYASVSLKWIQNVLPKNQIHFVGNKIQIDDFNIVFLSNVDYSIPKETLAEILNDIQNYMHPNSELIIMNTTTIFSDLKLSTIQKTKNIIKYILTILKLYSKGQFWGWQRTPEEYREILSESNLQFIEDGVIYPGGVKHYFIVGEKLKNI